MPRIEVIGDFDPSSAIFAAHMLVYARMRCAVVRHVWSRRSQPSAFHSAHAYRRAGLAIPSARASASRACAMSGWSSGSGVRTVSVKIFQCRLASSTRPMRA